MNTFWGCDTETMNELSTTFGERAGDLDSLLERTSGTVHATTWFGPDAEDYRFRTEDVVETARRLIETLRKLGELLGEESAEQTFCSQAEGSAPSLGDPLGVRAAPPWIGGGKGLPGPSGWPGLPGLSGRGGEGWSPVIGGPFQAEDPQQLGKWLPTLPDLEDLGPMIGGPFMKEDPQQPVAAPGPLSEGEKFALDPGTLADARGFREFGLGAIPVAGTVQTLMQAHSSLGAAFDGIEHHLQENGFGAFTPALSVLRVPHAVSGIAIGEKSVLSQVATGIDAQIANGIQTTQEVSGAIGDGDWSGAARAGERGMFRHVDVQANILTATPVPALAEASSELIGTGAEVVEPISPGAAARLHEAEQATRDFGNGWESTRDRVTDGERYYDLRREYAPMPWDPRV